MEHRVYLHYSQLATKIHTAVHFLTLTSSLVSGAFPFLLFSLEDYFTNWSNQPIINFARFVDGLKIK